MKQYFTPDIPKGKHLILMMAVFLPLLLSARTLEVGPDKTFQTISQALETAKQASSAEKIEIIIAPGLYKEQLVISGQSAGISIRPASDLPNSVVVQFEAEELSENYTVKIANASNVVIDGLEIQAKGTEYATSLFFEGSNKSIEIKNCLLKGKARADKAIYQSVIFCDDRAASESLRITDCEIEGGSFGIFGGGLNGDTRDGDLKCVGNIFTDQSFGGAYFKYIRNLEFSSNVVNNSQGKEDFAGFTVFDADGSIKISANLINFEVGQAGVHLVNVRGTASAYGELKNNSITLGFTPQSHGFLIEGSSDFLFLDFNRVKFSPGLRDPALFAFYKNLSSGESINMVNNIFYNLDSGGYTVIGNAFQKFLEQSGQADDQFSTQTNSLIYQEVR